MVCINIQFKAENDCRNFIIPCAKSMFCQGCAQYGHCNAFKNIKCKEIQKNRIAWTVCVHSSNIGRYLQSVLELNFGMKHIGIDNIECEIVNEPEEEHMYANIFISTELLKKLYAWQVCHFDIYATSGTNNDSHCKCSTMIDMDSNDKFIQKMNTAFVRGINSIKCGTERLARDVMRLRIVNQSSQNAIVGLMPIMCGKMLEYNGCRKGNDTCRMCITSRGVCEFELILDLHEIWILSIVRTSIEIVCIR